MYFPGGRLGTLRNAVYGKDASWGLFPCQEIMKHINYHIFVAYYVIWVVSCNSVVHYVTAHLVEQSLKSLTVSIFLFTHTKLYCWCSSSHLDSSRGLAASRLESRAQLVLPLTCPADSRASFGVGHSFASTFKSLPFAASPLMQLQVGNTPRHRNSNKWVGDQSSSWMEADSLRPGSYESLVRPPLFIVCLQWGRWEFMGHGISCYNVPWGQCIEWGATRTVLHWMKSLDVWECWRGQKGPIHSFTWTHSAATGPYCYLYKTND